MIAVSLITLCLAADPMPKEGQLKSRDSGSSAPKESTPRRPHPLAPSLPELTEKEEAEFDRIVERFILADTGRLPASEARSAMDEFKELGPEATFSLLRGFNKSAHINHSCPALTIARKLTAILRSSDDVQLLQYAKENIGAGVKSTPYRDVISDLKSSCTRRMAQLKR